MLAWLYGLCLLIVVGLAEEGQWPPGFYFDCNQMVPLLSCEADYLLLLLFQGVAQILVLDAADARILENVALR